MLNAFFRVKIGPANNLPEIYKFDGRRSRMLRPFEGRYVQIWWATVIAILRLQQLYEMDPCIITFYASGNKFDYGTDIDQA